MKLKQYLKNCFLLLIPIFIWNIIFVNSLPKSFSEEVFWKDIPPIIANLENILRGIVFSIPAFMVLSLSSKKQILGFILYLIGTLIYFLSWSAQIYYPSSAWSTSIYGFLAPAYTTIIWFIGIGLIGDKLFFKMKFVSAIYITLSVLFVIVHVIHVYLVYLRLYN